MVKYFDLHRSRLLHHWGLVEVGFGVLLGKNAIFSGIGRRNKQLDRHGEKSQDLFDSRSINAARGAEDLDRGEESEPSRQEAVEDHQSSSPG